MNLTPEKPTDAPAVPSALTPAPVLIDHERLDVYRVSIEFATMVPALTRAARASLRDQLERAAASVSLNLAEGSGRRGVRDRLQFFSIAQGSAMECAAAIDLLLANRHVAQADATRAKQKLIRVIQMIAGLRRAFNEKARLR